MKKFVVETSARHVHVTQETLEILFGKGAQLSVKKELSQPGQYASNEKVNIVGPKGTIKNVSILGPVRKEDQVEVSLTDARTLGVEALVKESGDLEGTLGVKLVNSLDESKEVVLEKGLIAAKRHIHMTEEDAKEIGVVNGEIVNVKVESNLGRNIIFADTVVRVSNSYALAMHIDTDESNACKASGLVFGEIIK